MAKPKVLFVDDDRNLLDGIARNLRGQFALKVAESVKGAFDTIVNEGPFAVVVSDLSMPHMDGIMFLGRVATLAPDSTRVLLTGRADVDSAIAAVNEGGVFRFVRKPCGMTELTAVLLASVEQHRLRTAERELLEKTLRGSVQALVEILALANQQAFGTATRIARLSVEVAAEVGITNTWPIEVAAMCSQIGAVLLARETLEKVRSGVALSASESAEVWRSRSAVPRLLSSIPRLERVVWILDAYCPGEGPMPPSAPIEAKILRFASALDACTARGLTSRQAFEQVRNSSTELDVTTLQAGEAVIRRLGEDRVEQVEPNSLQPGMQIAEEIRLANGTLLVARGAEVTRFIASLVQTYASDISPQTPLRVQRRGTTSG